MPYKLIFTAILRSPAKLLNDYLGKDTPPQKRKVVVLCTPKQLSSKTNSSGTLWHRATQEHASSPATTTIYTPRI